MVRGMEIFILILGLLLGLWLYTVSEKAIQKEREEKLKQEKETAKKLKQLENSKFKKGECMCDYIKRNGSSGYCHKHKTTWA